MRLATAGLESRLQAVLTPHRLKAGLQTKFSITRLRRRRLFGGPRSVVLGKGETGLQRAAGRTLQAADAAGDIDPLVHFNPHLAARAAEVALDTLFGVEPEVEEAEAVAQREETAQGTENPAPWAVN